MTVAHAHYVPPDVPMEDRASHELIKRIRKLRWIGMEDEARALERALRRASPVHPVLTRPSETD